jgi:hypothetical protein
MWRFSVGQGVDGVSWPGMLNAGMFNQTPSTMAESDYTRQIDRIIELLEEGRGAPPKNLPASSDRPIHSGHKGGAFISEAREAFNQRFAKSGLEWKAVNGWITTLYGIAGRARKEAPEASGDDLLWLYRTLRTSLDNGFAQLLSE